LQKIAYILLLLIIITGCSVSRKRSTNASGNEIESHYGTALDEVLSKNLTNTDFYIQRADVRLTQGNVTVHFLAAIRFKRPDTLLISVKSRAGIEAGRAFLTRDTVIISDRINKKLLVGDARSIKAKYGIESGYIYAILGDLIITEKDKKKDINCNKGNSQVKILSTNSKVEYTIDCSRKKTVRTYFEGDLRSANIQISYSDFIKSGRIEIPRKIEITGDKDNINVGIDIKKIEAPWKGSVRFIPGAGYKLVRIR
jgi:hypothetical protein